MLDKQLAHIEAVFFDLDGTLIDTAPDFITTVNKLRAEFDLQPLAAAAIRPHVSNGSSGLVEACLDIDPANTVLVNDAKSRLLDLYFETKHLESFLFPGADAFLQRLELLNIPWGIVTNKPARFADPLIDHLQLRERMVCLLCPDHVKQRKPDPESMYLAASLAKKPAERCFYFGDHLRDIQAGKAAGMATGSVAFGYIPAHEDPLHWNADYHFENFTHISNTFFPGFA